MERITKPRLMALADIINQTTGSPISFWTGKSTSPNHSHIERTHSGWNLNRTCSDGRGVNDILFGQTARELYDQMHAFLRGIQFQRGQTE